MNNDKIETYLSVLNQIKSSVAIQYRPRRASTVWCNEYYITTQNGANILVFYWEHENNVKITLNGKSVFCGDMSHRTELINAINAQQMELKKSKDMEKNRIKCNYVKSVFRQGR